MQRFRLFPITFKKSSTRFPINDQVTLLPRVKTAPYKFSRTIMRLISDVRTFLLKCLVNKSEQIKYFNSIKKMNFVIHELTEI